MDVRINISKRAFAPAEVDIAVDGVSEERASEVTKSITQNLTPLVTEIFHPATAVIETTQIDQDKV